MRQLRFHKDGWLRLCFILLYPNADFGEAIWGKRVCRWRWEMKPYKDPYKFVWICPICGEEKHAGGMGHINSQACGHMRNKHPDDCFDGKGYDMGQFLLPGLELGKNRRSLLTPSKEASTWVRSLKEVFTHLKNSVENACGFDGYTIEAFATTRETSGVH